MVFDLVTVCIFKENVHNDVEKVNDYYNNESLKRSLWFYKNI
jgi:hypothetical protein